MTYQDQPSTFTTPTYVSAALSAEDQHEYLELGLPTEHPHTFAKAAIQQLHRLPMLEQDATQDAYPPVSIALSA